MDAPTLDSARQNLTRIGLIAYEYPIYQVLSLEPFVQTVHLQPQNRESMDQPLPIGRIFKQIMGENS
jgi:hypothetical protein